MSMTTIDLSREQREVLEKEVNPIVQTAGALVIKTSSDSLEAQEILKEIKLRAKQIHEKFDPPVRAAHESWKRVKELYNFFTEPFSDAEVIIKRKIIVFEAAEQKKRDDAAKAAEAKRQEDERKRQEEIRRQAAEAEAKGKTEKAESLREKAETYVAPPVFMAPEPVQAQGTSFKKTWIAEVTDLPTLLKSIAEGRAPLGIISINQSALNQYAKGVKGTMPVPGLKFSERTDMSVRTK